MKAPHYRRFSSGSDRGRNAELALVERLKKNPYTTAFRTPGSKGAADVIALTKVPGMWADIRAIQVKSGRKPSPRDIAAQKARIRQEWPFPVEARVVWAKQYIPEPRSFSSSAPLKTESDVDGWEFVWL